MNRRELPQMFILVRNGTLSLTEFADLTDKCDLYPCGDFIRQLRVEPLNDKWMVWRNGTTSITTHPSREVAEAYARRFAVEWCMLAIRRVERAERERDRRLLAGPVKWRY